MSILIGWFNGTGTLPDANTGHSLAHRMAVGSRPARPFAGGGM